MPRDRNGTFQPQLVKKRQTRLDGFDDKVLSLYARGLSTRQIQGHLHELYGTEVSPDLISRVTDAVLEDVQRWRKRPLAAVWPIVYLDALVIRVRDSGSVRRKSVYLAIGVGLEGRKEVLGMWLEETEGARFWLKVVTELNCLSKRCEFFIHKDQDLTKLAKTRLLAGSTLTTSAFVESLTRRDPTRRARHQGNLRLESLHRVLLVDYRRARQYSATPDSRCTV